MGFAAEIEIYVLTEKKSLKILCEKKFVKTSSWKGQILSLQIETS